MVLPRPKPPSQLWREASAEARDFLERIVIAVHRFWQESDHYGVKEPIERLPNARVIWDDLIGSGRFDLTWQDQGAGEQIAVHIDDDLDGVFYLLGNQAQIHLLTTWLLLGNEDGFPAEMSDAEMDRMDFRRHLGFLDDAPAALMWATVRLYECCTFARPIYAELGLDSWGFWKDGQSFLPHAPGIPVPDAFADFDALMSAHPRGDAFRLLCRDEGYSFDLDGIARHWERNGYGLDVEGEGMRFGPLLAFLQGQERDSIDWLIGQIYAALKRLARLDYQGTPKTVSCPTDATNLPYHYDAPDMTKDFVDVGQWVERLDWRMREKRRLLLGRRFDNAGKSRTNAAQQARQNDAKKRREVIEEYLKTADLTPYRAQSSGRLKIRPLARAIESLNLFDGRTKSPIGHMQIEKILKKILKSNFSTKS